MAGDWWSSEESEKVVIVKFKLVLLTGLTLDRLGHVLKLGPSGRLM